MSDEAQRTKAEPCPQWADGEHLWERKYRVGMGVCSLVTSDPPDRGDFFVIIKACACGAEVDQR